MKGLLLWMLSEFCGWHICYDDKGAVCAVRGDVPYTSNRSVPEATDGETHDR